MLGNSTINGIEYKIYTGLPDNKQIENNKLFEMVDNSCPCSDKSACMTDKVSDETRRSYENAYRGKAFVLTEKLEELRKFIDD